MCIGADECDPDFCNIFDDLLHAVHGNWAVKNICLSDDKMYM